jgi:hypothetical protein
MAINVNYGPISSALGLAQQAGINQGKNQDFKNFIDFAGMQQQAQNEMDRRNATAIQNALGISQLQEHYATAEDRIGQEGQMGEAHQQMAQTQMNNENAYRRAELGLRGQAINNSANYRDQRLDQIDSAQATRDEYNQWRQQNTANQQQTREDAINQLTPEQQNAVRATGRMPYTGRSADSADNGAQSGLVARLRLAMQTLRESAYDPSSPNSLLAQPSPSVKGAIAGKESTFQAANNAVMTLQQQLAMIDARRASRYSDASASPLTAGTPVDTAKVLDASTPSGPGGSPSAAPSAPASGPGSASAPIAVSDASDYAALPSGTYYTDPTGVTRIKR